MKRKEKPRKEEREQRYPKKKKRVQDDEITSEEDEEVELTEDNINYDLDDRFGGEEEEEEEEDEVEFEKEEEENKAQVQTESIDDIRVKKAREYLDKISQVVETNKEENEDDNEEDPILIELRKVETKMKSKIPQDYAKKIENFIYREEKVTFYKGHKGAPTCLTVSQDEKSVFTAGKDGCIIKWNIDDGNKEIIKDAHKGQILCIALSTDGKFLASGGRDNVIKIWDAQNLKFIDNLNGHNGNITSLVFRMGTHYLYSSSTDRTVKVWDVEELAYTDSLYGHEGPVHCIDAMFKSQVVSVGEDRSLRFWKIDEESQLIFKGHKESIDCMRMINENTYFTGSQDGSIGLFLKTKKKPKSIFPNAHGGKWITSVSATKYRNVAVSGSSDGFIKFWKCDEEIQLINQIPVQGFINGVEISSSGKYIVAAIGREHRLGRWETIKSAKNGIFIYKL